MKTHVSYRLSGEAVGMLKEMAGNSSINLTSMLEIIIREAALQKLDGVKPPKRLRGKIIKAFHERVSDMNSMYGLPVSGMPTIPANAAERLSKFKKILIDEVNEINDIIAQCGPEQSPIEVLTAIADVLGDITIYCRSEAHKYGIPLEMVLDIIMDSNESKLDADGKPIHDENGKFLKGPNYWKPEPKISALIMKVLKKHMETKQ